MIARPADPAAEALATIAYISLPPAGLARFGELLPPGGIPLPVQTVNGRVDIASLSAEAIVAGMLRVLAWDPLNEHALEYRKFVKAVRPGLLQELAGAGAQKLEAREWDVAEEIFLALAGLYPERCEPLLDLAALHEERAVLYAQESMDAEAEREDEAAKAIYADLLSTEPPEPEAFFRAALFHLRKRDFGRAVSLLTTYAELDDDEEKTAKARELLAKLGESGYLDTLFKEAYDLIRKGEEEEGLAKAREFVGRYPTVWNGWFMVGWACRRLRRWEDGKAAFLEAIRLGADEADAWNELSICQGELGDLPGARASLEKALGVEPENVKIIANLGAVAYRQGRIGEASGFFRAALDIDPADTLAADWLARLERTGAEGAGKGA